jgi:GNAT superfamily N-acetyltransferase
MSDALLPVTYRISSPVANTALNSLFAAAWPEHSPRDFTPILAHSLAYVCAYTGETLVGFVNLAWDGGIHAFLLDTTVHPACQRQGIGRALVATAITAARARGVHWLHVDYEPHLKPFYHVCGFTPTAAGLIAL